MSGITSTYSTYCRKDDISPAWSNSSQLTHHVLICGVIGRVAVIIAMYHVMLTGMYFREPVP